MFTFEVTPENRIALELVILAASALMALFVAHPAKQVAESPNASASGKLAAHH